MSHLTAETLARLVDDPATAEETRHIDACDVCRSELEAMRDDVSALSTLPDMAPAPDAWDALELRLASEGLIRDGRGRSRTAAWFATPRLMQAAAAVVLFVAGSVAGRMTAAAPAEFADATSRAQPAGPSPYDAGTARPVLGQQERDPTDVAPLPVEAPQTRAPNVTLASSGSAPRYIAPRNMEEAAILLRQTEELYLNALTQYAELATQSPSGDLVSRLAALTSIAMTTEAALSQAPADPVINGYHLTALAQRDATLRQVAAANSERWY